MLLRRRPTVAALGAMTLFAACAGTESADSEDRDGTIDEVVDVAAAAHSNVDLPGTDDAAELWAFLGSVDYRSWSLWPGQGERYPGGEPHGSTLTTYVNRVASAALEEGAVEMPPGAIIVKENYLPDGQLGAVTTMYKVRGFNPEAGDWHWVKFLPDGSVDNEGRAQGKVPGCIGCHTGKADNDYLFTSPLGGGPR